ncbi:hypothetical protein [Bacillus tuaregi]|uniref:hypothetical protein n=1 Tax=Bacillus tuaregi TaxID=1816695 RepID=UPI0008F85BC0|nr:hypothetical protein [Bacillus tuaregi]
MKLAITKKDHTVLLLSRITQDYDWFYGLLKQNERITKDLIDSLQAKEKNFMENMFPIVLQQAILEWKEKAQLPKDLGENKEKWIQCSLCGTPNRYIHYIVNRQTRREINVGSECVKEYAFNDGNTEYQRKEARKIRRLNILNTELPGIKRIIENWLNEIEKYEIWIPYSVSYKYRQIGKVLKQNYLDFLDGKGSEDSINNFRELLSLRENEISIFKDYVDRNKRNDFAVTQSIYRWFKQNTGNPSIQTAFDIIKDDGMITYQTAHRIAEKMFMNKIMSLLNQHLEKIRVLIIRADNEDKSYYFEIESIEGCYFNISHQVLLQNFGWVLFEEEPFVQLDVIEFVRSSVIKDERSMDVLLKSVAMKFKQNNVKLRGYDYDYNEIVIYDEKDKKHRVFSLNSFVSKYKVLAVSYNNNLIRGLMGERGRVVNINSYQNSRDGFTPL